MDGTDKDLVSISKTRLKDLEEKESELLALYNAGVEYWDGYELAMKDVKGG